MILRVVFTASLLDAEHYRNSVENKQASSLVVSLGKALSGATQSWCSRPTGRQLSRQLPSELVTAR